MPLAICQSARLLPKLPAYRSKTASPAGATAPQVAESAVATAAAAPTRQTAPAKEPQPLKAAVAG